MGLGEIVCGTIAAGTFFFGAQSMVKYIDDTQNYQLAATAAVCFLAGSALANRTLAVYNRNKRETLRQRGKGEYTSRFNRSTESSF